MVIFIPAQLCPSAWCRSALIMSITAGTGVQAITGMGRKYSAFRISEICARLYSNRPDGVCGNDDCGQISAWYIFSAAGFYPVDPVSLHYELGTPRFDRLTMNLDSGRTFTVRAFRDKPSSVIPWRIMLNGRDLDRRYITYEELSSGGKLDFYLR